MHTTHKLAREVSNSQVRLERGYDIFLVFALFAVVKKVKFGPPREVGRCWFQNGGAYAITTFKTNRSDVNSTDHTASFLGNYSYIKNEDQ